MLQNFGDTLDENTPWTKISEEFNISSDVTKNCEILFPLNN